MKKHPYSGLHGDERRHVMEDCTDERDVFCCEFDAPTGINAEPTEGVRDGVASVKRLNPEHRIRTKGGY